VNILILKFPKSTIKQTIETSTGLNNIWVKGEIYNLTYHASGHIYFTLKDNGAIISATFFKFANRKLTWKYYPF